MMNVDYTISYGKFHVPVYRVYAQPLTDVKPIPESAFTHRQNTLFAFEVDVEVFGHNFLPAYLEGDNSNVVATDSMKNFILHQALAYEGSTLEGFLSLLGPHFLSTYPQMERLVLTGRELPFATVHVPQQGHSAFIESNVLFRRSHEDFAIAELAFERTNNIPIITHHRCGRLGLELFKVTGSAFTHFVRDEFTTLQERVDRPLFIYLDIYWKYSDVTVLIDANLSSYVPAEQVRDVAQGVFHEFVSESIQHLVHEIGQRLLTRFPQLAEISFEAQNRTRDQIATSANAEHIKVYSDPFSAYGIIKLTIQRSF